MLNPSIKLHLWCYAVPLALAAAMFLPGLWFPYWMHDAGLYAGVSLHLAREQPISEWGTLWNAGWPYFNKPPLGFWITALFVRCFGEATWVLRLPCVLAAMGCVALTVSIARRLHGHTVAMIAGILLALCSEYFWRTSRFRLDFPHTLFMLAAVRMCVEGVMLGRAGSLARARGWVLAAGVPVGLAMLVKPIFGVIALVLAGLWFVLVPATATGGTARPARRLVRWIPASVLIAVGVAAPWHIVMAVRHGEVFTHQYFIKQSVNRATGETFAAEPWWWYFQHLWNNSDFTRGILGATPTSGFEAPTLLPLTLGTLLAMVWWGRRKRLAPRTCSAGGLLAQVWTFGLLLALSAFGDKRAWYMIPVFPGMAWIAALWIQRVVPRGGTRWLLRVAGPLSVVALVAVCIFQPRLEEDATPPPDLAAIDAFILAHPRAEFWAMTLHRYENAPIYIRTGIWPRSREQLGTGQSAEPPPSAYLIYDLRVKTPRPDPRATVLATAGKGRFVIVQALPTGPSTAPVPTGTLGP